MTSQKPSTSLRIGIAVSMVIFMLGLAIFLNVFTTYAITNQTKTLFDLNIPINHGLSQAYVIQQLQHKSFEDAVTYGKLDSQRNYAFSKNQFYLYDKEFDSYIIQIKNIANTYINFGLDDNLNTDLDILIKNLDEIKKLQSQYFQGANQIFELSNKESVEYPVPMLTLIEKEHNQISSKTALLNEQVQKLSDNLVVGVEKSKQKSLTLQAIIIISAGIISLALCYFLNLINKDIIQAVFQKTMSLQKANRKLEKMNVLKDDFINIASHELKSPLQPLYGYVELAQNGDIEMDEALAEISKQVRQLEKVANRILDTKKIDLERLQSAYEKFDLDNLLMEIVSFYKFNLNRKVKIETDLEQGVVIEADKVAIGQVIRNLINNAIKFTEEGRIQISAHQNLEKNAVEVSISDDGPGIHPEIMPNIFRKYSTKGPKMESWNGNGLGLYVCKKIINMHGGHIFAYNNKGSGTTIKFIIPITNPQNVKKSFQKIMN